jgi:hypothetical protein
MVNDFPSIKILQIWSSSSSMMFYFQSTMLMSFNNSKPAQNKNLAAAGTLNAS